MVTTAAGRSPEGPRPAFDQGLHEITLTNSSDGREKTDQNGSVRPSWGTGSTWRGESVAMGFQSVLPSTCCASPSPRMPPAGCIPSLLPDGRCFTPALTVRLSTLRADGRRGRCECGDEPRQPRLTGENQRTQGRAHAEAATP